MSSPSSPSPQSTDPPDGKKVSLSPDSSNSPDSDSSSPILKTSIPTQIPSAAAPTYAQRLKNSLRNLRKIDSPITQIDGIPVVQAPPSIILQESWKDHIVAKFHGKMPDQRKIFADLNPVWGKFGNITIRALPGNSCLVFVPCASTRDWILQVGLASVQLCPFCFPLGFGSLLGRLWTHLSSNMGSNEGCTVASITPFMVWVLLQAPLESPCIRRSHVYNHFILETPK